MATNDKLRIPANTWILIGDGRKALVLVNGGDERYPNLQVRDIFHAEVNPPTHAQGSAAPVRSIWGGRVVEKNSGRRSAKYEVDWHELAEENFAREVVDALEREHAKKQIDHLIIVAPPRALSNIRHELADALAAIVVAEIDKDLTKHPVAEIERLLLGK
jgi:protein required for attachment to host cells